MTKVAIVTGANKGIGFEIAKLLATSSQRFHIIVACRSAERGNAAVKGLQAEFPKGSFEFAQVDLGDAKTIDSFGEHVRQKHGAVDVVVHNAAIAFKNSDPTPFEKQARPTLDVNYFGTLALHQKLLPLVRSDGEGRIVFVASQAGTSAYKGSSAGLKKEWKNVKSEADITALAKRFVDDVERGARKSGGWPQTCYGVSKLAVIALAKVEASKNPGIIINSVCPGYCSTDMSSHHGSRSAAKGAETPVYLATLPKGGQTGEFWYDLDTISFL